MALLSLYSTLLVTEPDYGDRYVRVHAGFHHKGISQTEAVDLLTGERVVLPISTSWDSERNRDVRNSAPGWSWHPIPLAEAEKRVGLPKGSLPPYGGSEKSDLWADQRRRCPAFISLLTVLTAHPEVVFYEVDWRHWVHIEHPREYPHDASSPLLSTPKQTSCAGGGRHVPYPLGGSGDMERYASQMRSLLTGASSPAARTADVVHGRLSEAVLADLAEDYERNLEWQRNEIPTRRLNSGLADLPVVRSLADIQSLVGWTPKVLGELDELYQQARERLDAETAAFRPQGVALSLF